MTVSPARVVATWLINNAHAVAYNGVARWSVEVGTEPEAPDDVITVYDTGGYIDGRYQNGGQTVNHPTVQIRIRSRKYKDGWDKGAAIQDGLCRNSRRAEVTIDSKVYRIVAFTLTNPMMKFGVQGQNDRQLFSINGLLTLEEV